MKKNSRKKAPAFQFYAADWLTDSSLRLVSAETRGIWIDLLCYSFLSSDPGFLIIGGQILDKKGIQKLSQMTPKKFEKVFNELTNFGILKQDEKGRFFCKRMVEDSALSQIRREAGAKGGNPKLIKKVETLPVELDNQNDKQNLTPSSSSSSSSSINKKVNKKNEVKKVEFVDHSFAIYVRESCPNVSKLKTQLTLENCQALAENFDPISVFVVLDAMENYKDLQKKYNSVYLTLNNWLKNRKNESTKTGEKSSFEDKLRDF